MAINTVEDLRAFLADELTRLRNGKSKPSIANASSSLAGKILSSVKLEIEYNKSLGVSPNIKFLGKNNNSKKIGTSNA